MADIRSADIAFHFRNIDSKQLSIQLGDIEISVSIKHYFSGEGLKMKTSSKAVLSFN